MMPGMIKRSDHNPINRLVRNIVFTTGKYIPFLKEENNAANSRSFSPKCTKNLHLPTITGLERNVEKATANAKTNRKTTIIPTIIPAMKAGDRSSPANGVPEPAVKVDPELVLKFAPPVPAPNKPATIHIANEIQ